MSGRLNSRSFELFHEVCDLDAAARSAVLDRACGDDTRLRAEVDAMLRADTTGRTPLDSPALGPSLELLAPDPAGPDADLAGRTLGGFHLARVIATGGMGTVYEAEQLHPRRIVAVKVMRFSLGSPSARRRFEYEASVLAQLRHPGIAQLYEAGTFRFGGSDEEVGLESPYFAMEYVADARSITAFVREHGSNLRSRLELFALVCDAVQHGHHHGVIHRDLKPENILVDRRGRPKVIDFGVARSTLADPATAVQQTHTGQLIGTLRYMSPEQCAPGAGPVDTRSDVYSLGVVLYEVLCNAPPYEVDRVAIDDAVHTIRETPPTRPSARDRALRGDVDTIVLTALEKPRERRYSSAGELAADIRRFLAHEPIAARPASSLYQLRRFARRHRALVGAGAAVLVTLLCGMVGVVWQAAEAARQASIKSAIYEFMHEVLTSGEPGRETTLGEILDRAASVMDFGDQPEVEFEARDMVAEMYHRLRLYEEELEQARAMERVAGRAFGEDSPRALAAARRIASNLHAQGRNAEAEPVLRRVIDGRRAVFGQDHDLVLDALNEMASVQQALGRHDEAERLFRDVVARRRTGAIGEDADGDDGLPVVLHNLALLLAARGRQDDAVPLMREAVQLARERLGGADHRTLTSMRVLGRMLGGQGHLREAEQITVETLAGFRDTLGDGHASTALAATELAALRAAQGRIAEARAVCDEFLAALRAAQGDNRQSLAMALHHFAEAFGISDIERAAPLAEESLALYHAMPSAPPGEHRHAVQVLVKILERRGELERKVQVLESALAYQRNRLEPGHPEMGSVLALLGVERLRREQFAAAERDLRECVEIRERGLGDDNWLTSNARSLLGEALVGLARYEEAERLLLASHGDLHGSEHAPPVRKAEALQRLVALYEAWQKPERAAEYRALAGEANDGK